jgi:hypothetical protein
MRKYVSALLTAAVGAVAQISAVAYAQSLTAVKDETGLENEIYKLIKKPKTPLELLENTKLAIENDLLLREEFYLDEGLKLFFGGARIIWVLNRRTAKVGDVRELGDLFENSRRYPGLGASFYREVFDENGNESESGKVRAHFVADTGRDFRLTVEVVEIIFGAPNEITNSYSGVNLAHPEPLERKTHRLGNTRLSYIFNRPLSTTSAWFVINGDGTVDRFGLKQEAR